MDVAVSDGGGLTSSYGGGDNWGSCGGRDGGGQGACCGADGSLLPIWEVAVPI